MAVSRWIFISMPMARRVTRFNWMANPSFRNRASAWCAMTRIFPKACDSMSASRTERVRDKYEILTAKRRVNDYRANRKVFHLQTAAGQKLDIIFQVSNDGVAFRYFFPETNAAIHRLTEEVSSFHFLPGTRAWLQPMSVAKSGWSQVNPSYEEFYQKDIPVGTPSTLGAGWVYPALFRSGDTWLLVSEGSLPRNYCGTRLRVRIAGRRILRRLSRSARKYSGRRRSTRNRRCRGSRRGASSSSAALKTIAESTLGIDLADKPANPLDSTVKPGKASWSWPLLGDNQTKYDVQKRFIDYAAEMGWRYCLIDALLGQTNRLRQSAELVEYARGKNVKILLWYNSAGDWNTAPQTPRDKMLTHESRIAEFEKLKALGVAGLKIDFFGGDGQSMIDYYHDILDDAAPYGFAMNFHGATLPRGWQRTYPNLMTMEAIRGLEYCHVRANERRRRADARGDAAVHAQCFRSDGFHADGARPHQQPHPAPHDQRV